MNKYNKFNIDVHYIFKIKNLTYNDELLIKLHDLKILSCDPIKNNVFFIENIDEPASDKNIKHCKYKWIIEKDNNNDNIVYIKNAHKRHNYDQYLGCPNKNNIVFLYTSKNIYTRWFIVNISDDNYLLLYNGEKFNKNDIELVVAKYKENIDWTYAYDDIVTIYNKHIIKNKNMININNLGREGHTYLYHIITRYDSLANKTIFCQGEPFEHNDTILYGIDNHFKFDPVQPLGLRYLKRLNIPPIEIENKFKKKTDYGLEYLIFHVNKNHDYHGEYYFHDAGVAINIRRYKNRYPNCESLFHNFLKRSNFPITKPLDIVRFTWCGLFSVSKYAILKYDINVYKNLLNELISFNAQGGENGYILERLWLYIFED